MLEASEIVEVGRAKQEVELLSTHEDGVPAAGDASQ